MTREEAIRHLEEWREIISSGKRKQVIDMAIEALQKDIVRCKDCDRKLGSTECPCCTKEYHVNEETFYCAWGERIEP